MAPYWLIFFIPAFAAISRPRRPHYLITGKCSILRLNTWRFWFFCLLTVIIGLRYEVGGDWFNYLDRLEMLYSLDVKSVLLLGDPGYRFLEWLSNQNHWGIYGTNLISSFLFSWGLVVFCWSLPRPWLALTVAVPYLVTVVAMGYTRQGVAIGLAMLGLVALGRQNIWKFVLWVLGAASFHKSAVLLLPIAALAATRKRLWVIFWLSVVTFLGYILFLESSIEFLYKNYILAEYQSEGTFVRLMMNVVPSVLFFAFWKKFDISPVQKKLWLWFALISLALFGVYFLTTASTALDRISLYLIPIQMVVFSFVPEVLGERNKYYNTKIVLLILVYYAAVLFVWLNFSSHSKYWLPYRNALFL